jgi:transposase InsO family protein
MKTCDIRARTHKRFIPGTTDSRPGNPLADNVLERNFEADGPDQKWAVDITYIPTDEGWLCLAGVMDSCSRKIVGWSMADHLRSELAADAWRWR